MWVLIVNTLRNEPYKRIQPDFGKLNLKACVPVSRYLVYIDMNMVRAGVVQHPGEWAHGGYREIQQPPKRYRIIK